MEANLLDKMLASYRDQRTSLTIVLQNKVKLTGTVKAFDNYVIVLASQRTEIIYRHAVSSILPSAAAGPAETPRRRQEQQHPVPRAEKPSGKPAGRQKQQRPAAKTPAPSEAGLNNGMKEGLLRWMQEQKAAK
jgi:host factor-I protein